MEPGSDAEIVELEPASRTERRRPPARVAIGAIAVGAVLATTVVVVSAPSVDHRTVAPHPTSTTVAPSRPNVPKPTPPEPGKVDSAAMAKVLQAMARTAGVGSYTTTYHLFTTPGAKPHDTSCGVIVTPSQQFSHGRRPTSPAGTARISPTTRATPISVCRPYETTPASVTGESIISTDPYAMVSVSQVTGLGAVTIRVDGNKVWEYGGADYGRSANGGSGDGSPFSGFVDLVEGTLGRRMGASSMQSMASPNGYLAMQAAMIMGAVPAGRGVVNGVAVTRYVLQFGPTPLDPPTTTSEARKVIQDADAVLKAEGLTGTTVTLSIDADNLIRESNSVAHFSDGGSTTLDAVFDGFGCTGHVLMPGQRPKTPKPPGPCVGQHTKAP